MRVQISGRQIELGAALQERIDEDLNRIVGKYAARGTDGIVTVERSAVGFEADCLVHLSSGISLQAHGRGSDAHAAFDDALGKIEKRLRRHKRRLRNHHNMNKPPLPAESATAYVLAPYEAERSEEDGEDDEAAQEAHANGAEPAPLVIAEANAPVKTMPVAMAVMQLELMEAPALLFRNAAHGELNVVYRRNDGNIGWIDPGRRTTSG